MADTKLWFLLSVEVQSGRNDGINPEKYIQDCLKDLGDNSPSDICVVFKFRVVGEPKLFLVLETSDPTEVTRVSSLMMSSGPNQVTCTSLLPYEEWAKYLGVSESLITPNPRKLSTPVIYMVEVDVELNGMTTDEFLAVCKDEATYMLTGRSKGFEFVLFSCLGERKVIGFNLGRSPFEIQSYLLSVPLVKKMFDKVHFKVTALSNIS